MRRDKKPFYASKTAIYEWLYTSRGSGRCKYLYAEHCRPKKRDDVKIVIDILNNKPRKSLNYKTAYEVMVENDLFINNKKIPVEKIALRG